MLCGFPLTIKVHDDSILKDWLHNKTARKIILVSSSLKCCALLFMLQNPRRPSVSHDATRKDDASDAGCKRLFRAFLVSSSLKCCALLFMLQNPRPSTSHSATRKDDAGEAGSKRLFRVFLFLNARNPGLAFVLSRSCNDRRKIREGKGLWTV